MNELGKFLKDPRFFVPAFFVFGFELFLQLGFYKPLLQPNSYAENINRIVNKLETTPIKADVLILGTSIAYQSVNLPLLNERLKPYGISVQSGASEGAKLINQHMMFNTVTPYQNKVKVLLHIVEPVLPWNERNHIDRPNKSMLAQFNRIDAIRLMSDYRYAIAFEDRTYFFIRSLTYQRDIRDFALDPLDRIKWIGRKLKVPYSPYPHENKNTFSMDYYKITNVKDCMTNSSKPLDFNDPEVLTKTNRHHQEAVYKTCYILTSPIDQAGAMQWVELFFYRLKLFYDDAHKKNIRVITLFPPISEIAHDAKSDERVVIWQNHLKAIHGEEVPYQTIDLRNSLDGSDNLRYYYDAIHMNREGSLVYTEKLAKEIIKLAPWILNQTSEEK